MDTDESVAKALILKQLLEVRIPLPRPLSVLTLPTAEPHEQRSYVSNGPLGRYREPTTRIGRFPRESGSRE